MPSVTAQDGKRPAILPAHAFPAAPVPQLPLAYPVEAAWRGERFERVHQEGGGGVPPPNPHFKQPPTGTREYILTVDTGELSLRFPEELSDEDYESVERWLDAMKRKIKRSVKGVEDSPT